LNQEGCLMKRIRVLFAIAAVLGISPCSTAVADENPSEMGDAWLRSRLGGFGANQKVDQLRQMLRGAFFMSDVDGGGVSAKDYELAEMIDKAQQRAGRINQSLMRDLDGDGVVTRAEIETVLLRQAHQQINASGVMVEPTPEQTKTILDRLVFDALRIDANKDGKLTLQEMSAEPEEQIRRNPWYGRQQMVPMALDTDKNGTVTIQEYDAAVDRIIVELDLNKDAAISVEEAANFAKAAQESSRLIAQAAEAQRLSEEAQKNAMACGLPKPASTARVVLIGTYEGQALSSASIGGDNTEISAVHVDIASGDQPLYIVASSYGATIWQVTGATERVAAFIASSQQVPAGGGKPLAGVEGLSKDQVFLPGQSNCMKYFSNAREGQGIQAAGSLTGLIGRKADDIIANYTMAKVTLPDGIVSDAKGYTTTRILPRSGAGAVVWREFGSNRAISEIDAEKVIAAYPVKPYEVLPLKAGIAQLLDAGALEILKTARVRKFGNTRIIGEGTIIGGQVTEEGATATEFRIVKKMRFPAGLNGGNSVQFVLGKGVPLPEGDPGHSPVISEETGQPVGGRGTGR
jgi:EF hand